MKMGCTGSLWVAESERVKPVVCWEVASARASTVNTQATVGNTSQLLIAALATTRGQHEAMYNWDSPHVR